MAFDKGVGNSVTSLLHETVPWSWAGGSIVDIWGSQQSRLMMTLFSSLFIYMSCIFCNGFVLIKQYLKIKLKTKRLGLICFLCTEALRPRL